MASIYKRGKTWYVHYYINGESVDRSLRTRSERVALEKKRKLEAAHELGQLDAPTSTPITEVVPQYVAYLIATRPRKSAKNDISYLRAFFGPCCEALKFGSRVPHKYRTPAPGKPARELPKVEDKLKGRHVPVRRLEQVSTEMISRFLLDRVVEDGIAPKTVNRQREVLRGLFNFALEHKGYVNPDRRYRNPVEGVRRHREPTPVISWLKQEDIQRQLTALDDHPTLNAMVAVYLFAGLRRTEALWLTPDDVDLPHRLIRVRAKSVGGVKWQPKTGRNRVVPIGTALLPILKAFDAIQPRNRTWFFLSPHGAPGIGPICDTIGNDSKSGTLPGGWDPDNFSAALRKVNRAHGLNWSCLDFRHTFGSHLAQRGMSLFKIAELMGNSPEICRRHYAALVPEQMHDEINFFNDHEKSPPPTPGSEGVIVEHPHASPANGTDPVDVAPDRPRLRLVR